MLLMDGIRGAVEADDAVLVAQQPKDHVAAHSAEADHADFHSQNIKKSLLWESKACGLSPQGYSPWTSLNNRLVALDTVRSVCATPLLLVKTFRASGYGAQSIRSEDPRGPGRVALGRKPAGLRLLKEQKTR